MRVATSRLAACPPAAIDHLHGTFIR
jgi:hypothetical protein